MFKLKHFNKKFNFKFRLKWKQFVPIEFSRNKKYYIFDGL